MTFKGDKEMGMKLFFQAITKYFLGLILVGLLLFVPAGTLSYWNAWLFIGLLFVPMAIVGYIMLIKAPKLLEKRLNVKETEKEQEKVVTYSGLLFIVGFIIAGLNYRFDWTVLPNVVITISSILFILSYIFYGEVLKENAYLSRTINIYAGQKVVDTGLYSIVRHPMYLSTIIMFLMIPLMLGSIISFEIFLIYPLLIIKRIKNEEEVLERDLEGYVKYKQKVKYRLNPFVW